MKTTDSNTQNILIEKIINEPQALTPEEINLIENDQYLSELYSSIVLCQEACTTNNVTIPDIEHELNNFKKLHRPHKPKFLFYTVRIAAIFTLVLISSAIVVASFNWQLIDSAFDNNDNSDEIESTTGIGNSTSEPTDTDSTVPVTNTTQLTYDNMTLRQIMSDIKDIYHVNIVFENNASKDLRLYLKIEPGNTITDVVEILNSFESITVTINNDDIIIK